MKILGLIVARRNNLGVPRKHLRALHGRPVISHVISYAVREPWINTVALSSDCPEILGIAREAGVEAIERPLDLAAPEVPVTGTLVHALKHFEEGCGQSFDAVAILYGNVPFRPAGALDRAIQILKGTPATAVRSYCPVWKCFPQFLVTIDGDRVRPYMQTELFRRQDVQRLFYPDGAVILVRTSAVFSAAENREYSANYFGDDLRGILLDCFEAIEIDDSIDLKLCEMIMEHIDI